MRRERYQRFEGSFCTLKRKDIIQWKAYYLCTRKKIFVHFLCMFKILVLMICTNYCWKVTNASCHMSMNITCISMYTLVIVYIFCNLGFLYSWLPLFYKKDNCFLDCKAFLKKSLALVLQICSVPPLPRNMSLIH